MNLDYYMNSVEMNTGAVERAEYIFNYLHTLHEKNLEEGDDSIDKIIYQSKAYLIDIAVYSRNNISDELYAQIVNFAYRPIDYLKSYYADKAIEFNSQERNIDASNCNNVFTAIDNCQDSYLAYEQERGGNRWVIDREKRRVSIYDKFLNLSNTTVQEAIEENKGGFFERVFKTTSNEYKHLIDVTEKFYDPASKYCGDYTALENATKAYVAHKLPSYNGIGEPQFNEAEIANLDATSRNRIAFCKGILDSVREAKAELGIGVRQLSDDHENFSNDIQNQVEDNNQVNHSFEAENDERFSLSVDDINKDDL